MSAQLRCILVTDADLTRAVVFPTPYPSRAVMVRIIKRKLRGVLWGILAIAGILLAVWLAFAIQGEGLL